MKFLPITFIYTRLFIGILVLIFSIIGVNHYSSVAITLCIFGVILDVFDGIIARKLKISTPSLRKLDSNIDQIFFILIAIATYIECPIFFNHNKKMLIILFVTEAFAYIFCFLKFKKEIATHTIGAKLWTIILLATLVQIIATCNSNLLFTICFYVGIITRLEIIGIIFLLPNWINDVPSIYHAYLIKKGKPIKRNKMFNG